MRSAFFFEKILQKAFFIRKRYPKTLSEKMIRKQDKRAHQIARSNRFKSGIGEISQSQAVTERFE